MRLYFILSLLVLIFSCTSTQKTTTESTNESTNTSEEAKETKKDPKKVVDDYFEEDYKKFNTTINRNDIKTVLAHKPNWEISESAMALRNDTLIFSFDEITSDLGDYYYTFIHCNADWTKSDLLETEYLDGYFQDFINNFKYSFNTLENYIHYEVRFPNKNIRPTKSGNYIFKVYNNNDPDDVVLTKRFIVFENIIGTESTVKRPAIIDDRDDKQEIDFNLDLGELKINDIYNDIKVTLMQNNRWDNAITDLKPIYINGSKLNYDYNEENVFNGLNEYRPLNIQSLRFRGNNIKQIVQENKRTDVYLFPEKDRQYKNYISYEDINGTFIAKIQGGIDSRVEADYATVHFALASKYEITGGDIYVFGGLSNYRYEDRFRLTYNEATKAYETSTLLKQGYYDYHFAFKSDNGNIDIPKFEGNHFETVNNYTIITYKRDQMSDYDRIIGYYSFLSNKQ